LSRHFRVLRYDIRGHGRSPVIPGPSSIDDLADDVVALLDRLGLDRVHFVGLSIGGMTGMRLAAREPGRHATTSPRADRVLGQGRLVARGGTVRTPGQ